MFNLKGKTIVVTGGSGLLGSAFVEGIRSVGGRCINADISLTTDFAKDNYRLDITSEQSVEELIEYLDGNSIQLDGWVNNAYPRTKDWGAKLEDIPLDSWRANVDMHLNGYFNCCQKALGYMAKAKSGSLINIGSIYGSLGPDFTVYDGTEMTMPAGYAAIKGGIINLSRYLAAYYGPSGIRINTLSPGGIFDNQPESFVSAYSKKVPMRRLGAPADITPSLLYLLSDASSYVTGQNLMVDGGWGAI